MRSGGGTRTWGRLPVVAVSGIIGGKALKGPADRMLTSLGHESSALGVARLYAGIATVFVLDAVDAALDAGDRGARAFAPSSPTR